MYDFDMYEMILTNKNPNNSAYKRYFVTFEEKKYIGGRGLRIISTNQ